MRRRAGSSSETTLLARLALASVTALIAVGLWTLVVPAGSGAAQVVTVAPGQSAAEVASTLAEKGLIRNPEVLALTAYVSGRWRRIQAGRHELAASMSALEILDALCCGSRKTWRWLTIPEGYTLEQIAKSVEAKGLGRASDFLREAYSQQSLSTEFPLPNTGLEGYLFPDTYRVDSGEQVSDILMQMLRRFDEVVWQGLFQQQPTYRGRSLNEIIILASLVEAEAKRDKERPLIAGVLMNRLRRGERLECDATVQYALGEGRKPRLMLADTQIESDYNTYLHAGLPPGPICNPGEPSIRAAMDPKEVPYLYYVARPDGRHVFSRTFEEHQAAIARHRSGG